MFRQQKYHFFSAQQCLIRVLVRILHLHSRTESLHFCKLQLHTAQGVCIIYCHGVDKHDSTRQTCVLAGNKGRTIWLISGPEALPTSRTYLNAETTLRQSPCLWNASAESAQLCRSPQSSGTWYRFRFDMVNVWGAKISSVKLWHSMLFRATPQHTYVTYVNTHIHTYITFFVLWTQQGSQ